MDYRDLSTSFSREQQLEAAAVFPVLMRKVYLWMTFALIITAITAYVVGTSETLLTAIYTNSVLFWGLIIAEFALVFGLRCFSYSIQSLTELRCHSSFWFIPLRRWSACFSSPQEPLLLWLPMVISQRPTSCHGESTL